MPDDRIDFLLDAVNATIEECALQVMYARTRMKMLEVEISKLREPPEPRDDP